MSFTFRQGAVGTAVSGTTVTSGTLGSTPNTGQLLVAVLRLPAPVTTVNNSGITVPVGYTFAFSAPQNVGGGTMWASVFYKQAGASEPTSISASWPLGTAAATAAAQAILEYDEFDGFSGVPTLDLSQAKVSTAQAVSGSASYTATAANSHELAIATAAVSFTSGIWNPGGGCQYTGGSGGAVSLALTDPTTSGYQNVGWVDYTAAATGAISWNMQWTTSRAFAVLGLTFQDVVSVTQTAYMGKITHSFSFPRVPWHRRRKSGLILPGFADRRLVTV